MPNEFKRTPKAIADAMRQARAIEMPVGYRRRCWNQDHDLLVELAGRVPNIFPSQTWLAKQTGIPYGTVRRALDRLASACVPGTDVKLVEISTRKVDGHWDGHQYRLPWWEGHRPVSTPPPAPSRAQIEHTCAQIEHAPCAECARVPVRSLSTPRAQIEHLTIPLPSEEEEGSQEVNDHHDRGGGGSTLLEDAHHEPDEQGEHCACGYRHNRFVEPCTVCDEDVPRLAGVWSPADGPRHLRCADDPDWRQREERAARARREEVLAAQQRAEAEVRQGMLAAAMAEPTKANLEELTMPEIKNVAATLGLQLPDKVRAAVVIEMILEATS